MRVALISDLHGNDLSLSAVLQDIDRRGADEVICLGDVATLGPRPHEVLETLEKRGLRCILGNHDEFMLDPMLIRTYTEVPIVVDAVEWCRDVLAKDEVDFLSRFHTNIEVELDENATLFLFHGSPRSNMEDLLSTMDADELDECLAGAKGTVMAGGHTHIQMLRQHRGTLLVNPGSVGMPFKEFVGGCAPTIMPYAEYAMVEADDGVVHVDLRRVAVDKPGLRKQASCCPTQICRSLEAQYG